MSKWLNISNFIIPDSMLVAAKLTRLNLRRSTKLITPTTKDEKFMVQIAYFLVCDVEHITAVQLLKKLNLVGYMTSGTVVTQATELQLSKAWADIEPEAHKKNEDRIKRQLEYLALLEKIQNIRNTDGVIYNEDDKYLSYSTENSAARIAKDATRQEELRIARLTEAVEQTVEIAVADIPDNVLPEDVLREMFDSLEPNDKNGGEEALDVTIQHELLTALKSMITSYCITLTNRSNGTNVA